MALHAISEAGLRWLTIASGGAIAIAVRLLRRNSHAWACSEHQLGCAWNTKHKVKQHFKNVVILSFLLKREALSPWLKAAHFS